MSANDQFKFTEEMLKDAAKLFRCWRSAHSPLNDACGCGVIHDIFYCCKHHFEEFSKIQAREKMNPNL